MPLTRSQVKKHINNDIDTFINKLVQQYYDECYEIEQQPMERDENGFYKCGSISSKARAKHYRIWLNNIFYKKNDETYYQDEYNKPIITWGYLGEELTTFIFFDKTGQIYKNAKPFDL